MPMVDDGLGGVVLTYRELGERLGIEPDSARARARRRGWRVMLDNHGVARVHVPPGELPNEPPTRGARTVNGQDTGGYMQGALAELAARLTHALDEVREERARGAASQAREVEMRIAHARMEAEGDAARVEAGALRTELETERVERAKLMTLVEELTRPWPVRLLRALRR
jgi:hypothetical protein